MIFGPASHWHLNRPYSAVPEEGGASPGVDAMARPPASSESAAPAKGLFDEISNAVTAARAAFSSFLDLVSLEARRAGLALVWMVAFAFIAAICVVSAWLGLMAALVLFAMSLGVPAIAAIIAVTVINLGVAAALIYRCTTMSRDLLFSATRRQVAGNPPAKPPAS